MSKPPIPCVGVIVFRGDHVLLIKRKNPPKAGQWSIPGGRIEPGESQITAAHRELLEETGVRANIIGKVAKIDARFEGFHYALHDYAAVWTAGKPYAQDDALHAEFVPLSAVPALGLWEKTEQVIADSFALIEMRKAGDAGDGPR